MSEVYGALMWMVREPLGALPNDFIEVTTWLAEKNKDEPTSWIPC